MTVGFDSTTKDIINKFPLPRTTHNEKIQWVMEIFLPRIVGSGFTFSYGNYKAENLLILLLWKIP